MRPAAPFRSSRTAGLARTIVVAATALLMLGLSPTITLAPAAAEPGTPAGSVGIRLLDVPAKLKDDPRAQLYIVDNLAPGTTVERRVQVTNNTDRETTIAMYAGPAQIVDGDFTPGEPGTKNMLTSWISLDKPEVKLKPGQKAKVKVTIAVPKDAPETEQYAVVWASTAPDAPKSGGVALASRVGVRVYLSVGPGNGPPADFSIGSLAGGRSDDGGATVTARVANTGQRAVDVSGRLELTSGPGGLSAEAVGAQGATIAPGESADVLFTVPNSAQLPDGPWTAKVTLESGIHSHTATESITFTKTTPSQVGGSSDLALILAIIGILVAAVVAIGAWVWQRRLRSGSDGRDPR